MIDNIIPSISAKWTSTSQLKSINTKETTIYTNGNADSGVGQAQQSDGIISVDGISTIHLLISGDKLFFLNNTPTDSFPQIHKDVRKYRYGQ